MVRLLDLLGEEGKAFLDEAGVTGAVSALRDTRRGKVGNRPCPSASSPLTAPPAAASALEDRR